MHGKDKKNPEGWRLLVRHRLTWEDNIKMELSEVVLGGLYWINLTQVRGQYRISVNSLVNRCV
jgi:hypothetical protein